MRAFSPSADGYRRFGGQQATGSRMSLVHDQRANAADSSNESIAGGPGHRQGRGPSRSEVSRPRPYSGEQVVDEAHFLLRGNPIRDYVPVLVQRTAKNRLRGMTAGDPAPLPGV